MMNTPLACSVSLPADISLPLLGAFLAAIMPPARRLSSAAASASVLSRGGGCLKDMARHIAHRLMISLPVLLGVLLIGFLLLQVVPIDAASVVAGPTATRAGVEAIRQQLGLDEPLWIQSARYLGRALQLDLGRSMISNRPVAEEIALTFWPTVELMLACLIWAVPLGIALGTLAAR